MILKRKLYTKYDDTDALKRMKDSDILAATPKEIPSPSSRNIGMSAASGALLGGGIGSAIGGITKKGIKKGGLFGAALGAAANTYRALNKSSNVGNIEDIEFYNRRLNEAQKWARRREKIDWKNNMTNRQGYSY